MRLGASTILYITHVPSIWFVEALLHNPKQVLFDIVIKNIPNLNLELIKRVFCSYRNTMDNLWASEIMHGGQTSRQMDRMTKQSSLYGIMPVSGNLVSETNLIILIQSFFIC